METLQGTFMLGIIAMVSLPIAVVLMVWGLASESAIGEVTPALKNRYEKLDDLYTNYDARTGLRHAA